ncbi:hypothetical protein BpHYR1_028243 [Brachionus plicatilis]|uniref:Uncharacterized protein n=1 Tax=Brachionus plicatilis TaxID=10195 RepID=A0A3M7R684_BRAPC|nr:hypothetical protein BpHYR1_028243 [Brachionus plicatilis]
MNSEYLILILFEPINNVLSFCPNVFYLFLKYYINDGNILEQQTVDYLCLPSNTIFLFQHTNNVGIVD